MNRLSLCGALAAAGLAAGCASAPQAVDLQSTAQLGYTDASQSSAEADTSPNLVVDAQEVHPGSEVVCRDMLQHASNVIRTRCLTVDDWRRYQQQEAQRAQALLRSWQGSAYSSW